MPATFMRVKMTLLANPKLDVVTKAVTTIRAIHTIVRASSSCVSRVWIKHMQMQSESNLLKI